MKDEAALYGCWCAGRAILFGLLLACAVMPANAASSIPSAFLKKGVNLQKLLDTTGELWLAPDVDYRSFGGKPLKVPSGAKILSRWNARLPVLVIEGGVRDVWIEGLDGGGTEEPDIVFTGGMPNRNITIIGGNGGRLGIAGRLKVRLEDDSRVEGLDLAEYGALEVLQGTSGYVRHSVFAHALGYRPGSTIWWEGNEKEPSSANSFLHISSITPQWKSRWNHAGPLLLVGWDCESWNGGGKGDLNCFEVSNSPSLISMGLSGGTAYPEKGGALASLRNVRLFADFGSRPRGGNRENTDLVMENVHDHYGVFRFDFRVVERHSNAERVSAFKLDSRSLPSLSPPVQPAFVISDLLQSHVFPPLPLLTRTGAFSAPMGELPSLVSVNAGGVASDQAHLLQQTIDRDGVARVAPGIYRLARSLKLGSVHRTEGLVASSPGEVVLVADGNFPVIRGREFRGETPDELAQQSVVLSGLALVGGSHGIYWSAESGNVGPGMKVAHSTFESLRLIGQTVAGVAALGIEGIDSNSWRRVSFEDMPVALMGVGKGGKAGMNYADKQGFMLCTFRNVRNAVWSWDSERQSGGNFWYRSHYDRVGQVSRTRAATNLVWFSSIFHDIVSERALKLVDSGTTVTGEFYVISSRWTGKGPPSVSDTGSWGVGTYFLGSEFLQDQTGLVEPGDHDMLFSWANRIENRRKTELPGRYMIINSNLSGTRTGFDVGAKILSNGR